MTKPLNVERLMMKAGHMLPPGSALKPAERTAIEDLIRVVRAEALEEAAKLCRQIANDNSGKDYWHHEGCIDCEAAIRALAEGVR